MAAVNVTYELPHDMTAEAGVLGEILTTGRVSKVSDLLRDDTFYSSFHGEVARSVRALFAAGAIVSYTTVRTDLVRRGVHFDETELVCVANQTTDGLPEQLAYLNDLALRRRIATCATELLAKVQRLEVPTDEVLAVAGRLQASDDEVAKDAGLREIMAEAEAVIDANRSGAAGASGTATGFPFLDDRGGLRKGTLTVIGGATSHGKTSFAMAIVKHAVRNGEHIGVFSLEMQGVELGQRMIATEAQVENYKIAAKPLDGYELSSVWAALRTIRGFAGDIHIDRRKVATIGTILESAARMVRLYGVKGIVVDFIQIVDLGNRRGGESEEYRIAEVTRQLKLFALQNGVWVMALSQLNRDGDQSEPDINRMRGSGRIGENADNVMLFYRPEAYPDGKGGYKGRFAGCEHRTAEIIMPKGRNTGVGKYLVAFDAATTDVRPIADIADYMPL